MASNNIHYYLIPGMGANALLYAQYNLEGAVHALDWPSHRQARTLAEYAAIVAEQVTTENNIIVGSSMGGMVATELSHIVKPKATILLSAPSGRHQFPMSLRMLRQLRLHRMLGPKQVYALANAADLFMGFQTPEDRERFYKMLRANGPEFLHFSVQAVLEWNHKQTPTGTYIHILGDRDKLFKPEKIPHSIVIRGAGHFATYEKSDLISRLINAYVRNDFDRSSTLQYALSKWPDEMGAHSDDRL